MFSSYADDPLLSVLLNVSQNEEERALAARYAPILRFDRNEPFCPLAVGYTILHHNAPSPSFRQGYELDLAPDGEPPASLVIEYAIWWDWDIGHLYELEHVWVYVDQQGRVVRGEASWHGGLHDMRARNSCAHAGTPDEKLALEDNHLVLYSEPGKHAFAPTPVWFRARRHKFKRSETSTLAGAGGVLITPYTREQVTRTPLTDRLVHSYLAQHAFEPSWDFSTHFPLAPDMLVPWPALAEWIPGRVNHWLEKLAREIPPCERRFLRIGHRGAAAHAPDNTLASLHKAVQLGADMAEFDLQRTADGHIVLAHDAWLRDESGRIWPVRTSTLSELQAIDLGGGERVLTLEGAIKFCLSEQLGAYIELKDAAVIPGLAATVDRYGVNGYVVVGSFRPDWLAEFKERVPRMATSILFGSPHLDAVQLAQSIGASYVHPCWEHHPDPSALLTPQWIARVREAGLGIICWHEERPEQIAALRQLGVDGICSDAPELLLDAPESLLGNAQDRSSHTRRTIP
jgi:glycerophosphoryl diester phosphodiesterase